MSTARDKMQRPPIRIEKPAPGGRVQSVHWECPFCRGKVAKNDRYCRHCGEGMIG